MYGYHAGEINNKDNTKTTITLGRYTFDTSTGEETLEQDAENYLSVVAIKAYYQELSTFSEGIASEGLDGRNATARDLARFLSKSEQNGGYYLGRYEASYASGTSKADYVPYSKPSTSAVTSSWVNTEGRLWNNITQIDAAAACRNMYGTSSNYESDLVNSYAWDTAIVFLQKYSSNSEYSIENSINSEIANTGSTGDKVCNVFDMASNLCEWTTEHSVAASTYVQIADPCVERGGFYDSREIYPVYRQNYNATFYFYSTSFRPLLYM